jgi:hypothetical protein
MKQKHKYLGIIILFIGVILVAIGELINSYTEISFLVNLFGNFGTAVMAVGVIELIFKSFLQVDLIDKLILQLKTETNNPFKASFLRRRELPFDYQITELIENAKEEIVIKAVALRVNKNAGLMRLIAEKLNKNDKLKIRILLLNPENKEIHKAHCDFIGLSVKQILADLDDTIKDMDKIKEKYSKRFEYVFYNTFPTTGIILIDPELQTGIAKLEFAVVENSSLDENVNIVLERKQDEKYFTKIHDSLKEKFTVGNIGS